MTDLYIAVWPKGGLLKSTGGSIGYFPSRYDAERELALQFGADHGARIVTVAERQAETQGMVFDAMLGVDKAGK